jgi:hypothetical protein
MRSVLGIPLWRVIISSICDKNLYQFIQNAFWALISGALSFRVLCDKNLYQFIQNAFWALISGALSFRVLCDKNLYQLIQDAFWVFLSGVLSFCIYFSHVLCVCFCPILCFESRLSQIIIWRVARIQLNKSIFVFTQIIFVRCTRREILI